MIRCDCCLNGSSCSLANMASWNMPFEVLHYRVYNIAIPTWDNDNGAICRMYTYCVYIYIVA